MEKICMREELLHYNLEGKWNNYIPDYHHEDGYTFAYLVAKIMIDEDVVNIRITVKKKIAVNWFWIHNIDELTSPE